MILFIKLYMNKVVLTFKHVDEMPACDPPNEGSFRSSTFM